MAEVYEGAVDRGLEGVVACTTAISSIMDATLCYRGYTIEDLAENSTFEEVTYLLWYGELPTAAQLADFKRELSAQMRLEAGFVRSLRDLPTKDVHPMAWLRTAVSMLSLWEPAAQEETPSARERKARSMVAKMGLMVTAFARFRQGQELVAAHPDKSVAWNFLYTLKGEEPDPELVKVFDTCLILHADHELNCSAFAARVTASSLSDIYSAVVSAIGALKGPLHGGANEQVMLMLKDIGSMERANTWIKEALANKQKVMGFGHRVYKNGDPRAKILRTMSERLGIKTGQPHWYEMSSMIDETVQREKGLLPNVDFYSATVYYSMGIETDLYTPIFATSRVSGWIAHILEQNTNNRIYRPRGKWTGKDGLVWKPAAQRG